MAVGPNHFPTMHPIPGVRLGTTCAGIKKPGRKDLVIVEVQSQATVSAVFTQNAFCAAPVIVAKQHLGETEPRYLLINTGNANAGTGSSGLKDALSCCMKTAELANVKSEQVLPFSTGVIGEPLPVDAIFSGLPAAFSALDENGWADAAEGILTTDTRPKGATTEFEYQGIKIHISGITKGSGMIRPDMATMLAFVATDAPLSQKSLDKALQEASDASFNRISVDGDTSTNDACVLISTGNVKQQLLSEDDEFLLLFQSALNDVCIQLAQAIVKDGEGATKFVTIAVNGGESSDECLQVAYAIAHSPLVKTALFASDPNWGRILAVVGRAGLNNLDVSKISIFLGDVCIADAGGLSASYTEEQGQAIMSKEEILIRVELNRGEASDSVWTTDLSHDYVSINSDYRS